MRPIDIIGLKNFRIFNDEDGFLEELSSINILTGANNSGKSSIIKSLQMLKNSINRKQFPFDLDLSEQEHLLGDFDDILFNKENRSIVFSLPFPFLGMRNIYVSLSFIVPSAPDAYSAKLRKIEVIDREDDAIVFSFAYREATEAEVEAERAAHIARRAEYEQRRAEKAKDKSESIFDLEFFVPQSDNPLVGYVEWTLDNPKLKNYLGQALEFYKFYLERKRDRKILEKLDSAAAELPFAPSILVNSFKTELDIEKWEEFIENGLNGKSVESGKEPVGEDDLQSEDFYYPPPEIEEVLYYFSLRILSAQLPWKNPDKADGAFFVLEECFKNTWKYLIQRISVTHYISTIREANSRVYLGSNDSAFINLLKDYSLLALDSSSFFINKYLTAFEIGKAIEVEYELKYQLVKVSVIGMDGRKRELVDYGYGIKQLILILIQISVLAEKNRKNRDEYDDKGNEYSHDYYDPSLLLIEEPETNLHPKWQSLLAAMFAEANDQFKIQMIIETHSEYLIRKFQTLVAAKDINGKDIKIFYLRGLQKIPANKKQLSTLYIQEDGSINYKVFDGGFFDESHNLELGLLNFQRDKFLVEFEALKVEKKESDDKITELQIKIDQFTDKLDLRRYRSEIGVRFDTSKLSPHSADYMASAEFMLNTTGSGGDFSPVILQYGRAVENELRDLFHVVDPNSKFTFAKMQGSLEKFKNSSTALESCIGGQYATLVAELANKFTSPINLRIDLLDEIRTVRNSAAHPGHTKSRLDAVHYITIVNDFLQMWITEKK